MKLTTLCYVEKYGKYLLLLRNGKKISWLGRGDELATRGLWGQRVCFTTENPREVDGVLKALRERAPFDPGACTRGLYLRGVE